VELLIKRELKSFGITKSNIDRKSNFAKINTEALFDAVDFDKSGGITEDEWLAFWEIVRKSGYTEEEINEEVLYFLKNNRWMN
jgi:hypothetical protein